jgi:hypothetical protein
MSNDTETWHWTDEAPLKHIQLGSQTLYTKPELGNYVVLRGDKRTKYFAKSFEHAANLHIHNRRGEDRKARTGTFDIIYTGGDLESETPLVKASVRIEVALVLHIKEWDCVEHKSYPRQNR